MELLPSGTIQDLRKNQYYPEEEVSGIISQVCQGLKEMHKHHILHRDIKP